MNPKASARRVPFARNRGSRNGLPGWQRASHSAKSFAVGNCARDVRFVWQVSWGTGPSVFICLQLGASGMGNVGRYPNGATLCFRGGEVRFEIGAEAAAVVNWPGLCRKKRHAQCHDVL